MADVPKENHGSPSRPNMVDVSDMYPDQQSFSAVGGGGAGMRHEGSSDPFESVLAFYEAEYGPAHVRGDASASWNFSSENGDLSHSRLSIDAVGQKSGSESPNDQERLRTHIHREWLYQPDEPEERETAPVDRVEPTNAWLKPVLMVLALALALYLFANH